MPIHGLLQKAALDAMRLPYRIRPGLTRFGEITYRVARVCKTGETDVASFEDEFSAQDFLMRKLSVEA